MAKVIPSVREWDPEKLPEVCVKGGIIVAWGKTDIYDPLSELHSRDDIGIYTQGRYHSVNTGKLTMAPLFAELCAARICG